MSRVNVNGDIDGFSYKSKTTCGCDHVWVEMDEGFNSSFNPLKQKLICCLCGRTTTERKI